MKINKTELIEQTLKTLEDGRLNIWFENVAQNVLTKGSQSGLFDDFSDDDMDFVMKICLMIAVERISLGRNTTPGVEGRINSDGLVLAKKIRKLLNYHTAVEKEFWQQSKELKGAS